MRTHTRATVAVAILLVSRVVAQQPASKGTDWPMYRHDLSGTGHSPLSQINAKNVARLTQAWTYRLQPDTPPGAGQKTSAVNSQATPIVVNGVMYLPAVDRVVALDPETGKEIWRYIVENGAPSRRGVAYWPGDGTIPARILFSTGRRLVALDARTGAMAKAFGTDGGVEVGIPYNSVPGVIGNIVVIGANTPPGTIGGIGNPRAYDARTGAKVWEFSSVAQPGAVGHDSWAGESWKGRLGANAWPFYFTADEQQGVLYLPLASPIPGAWGGDRAGANLYGNSVVAVDVRTGAYKWHFQTIHHDLWDHDPPAPPGLFEITRNGRRVPALGVTTKSGYLYILNRETGEPIFGVDEKPVPKSDVPGEQTAATQPFPRKPTGLARNSYSAADLVTAGDTTPEHAKACAELVEKVGGVVNAGPFTPWGFRAEGAPLKSSLLFPGGLGGPNWGGTTFDPDRGLIIVATQDVGALGSVERAKDGSPVPYQKTTPGRATFDVPMGDLAWPCQRPPWGRLTAVNASTGDVVWQVPLGITDQLPPEKQRTGRPPLAGAITTASGLLFIASTDDNRFRAFETKSGRELWVTRLERRGNADPITYQGRNGKQYVVVVATDTVAAYALP
jgi:glucose dehydrogenase